MDSEWTDCPECGVKLKSKNLLAHVDKVHEDMPKEKRREIKDLDKLDRKKTGRSSLSDSSRNRMKDIGFYLSPILVICIILSSYYFIYYEDKNDGFRSELVDNDPSSNNKLSFNLNDYRFTELSNGLPDGDDFNFLDLGDIDNDGDLDIAACSGGWSSKITFGIYVYLYDAGGKWTPSNSGLPTTGTYGCIVLADINMDGNLDILTGHEKYATSHSRGIEIFLGDGLGNWRPGNSPFTQNYAGQIVVQDINRDGKPDIVAALQVDGIKVWLGDGGSSWTERSNGLPATDEFTGIALGDVNNDGHIDLAAATYNIGGNGRGVHVFKNNGDLTWSDSSGSIKDRTHRAGMGIMFRDFNGDGNLDLIYNTVNKGFQCFTGNGNFVWTEFNNGVSNYGSYISIDDSDINNDGNIDLIMGTSGLGLGLYTWNMTEWVRLQEAGLPTSGVLYTPVFGDIDNDGDTDIACATIREGIRVWMGEK
jgi:hypothetical protein